MRAFLVCTLNDQFHPVEEVQGEGAVAQSIERHCDFYGEDHRPAIRVVFPEAGGLRDWELAEVRYYTTSKYATPETRAAALEMLSMLPEMAE